MQDLQARNVGCFGPFKLDLKAGELYKDAQRVRLQEQPFQVLKMLMERPGEVVTRDEIQKKLWPNDTIVEFDHSINAAIKRLRDALGETAEKPKYVETVARRGYRLLVPVQWEEAKPADEAVAAGAAMRTPPLQRRWALTLGLATLVLAGVVLAGLNVANFRDRVLRTIGAVREPPLQIQSIAVLPLENLSRDPDQEYFADGMTEELITNLSKISALRVISRTSVMRYKGTKKPLPEIAKELNVDALVEGTVLRSGNRVRITANLLHAPTDRHLWADGYERDLGDVLALQSEVAIAIAREVQVKLTPQEQARLARAVPFNPEAHEAYIRGRMSLGTRTKAGVENSIEYFEKAIALDPTYAVAYTGLADAYSAQGHFMYRLPKEAYPRAKEQVAKALALDGSLAEAYASLCRIRVYFDWDWPAAERDCTRAVELNPNSATALASAAWYYIAMGRFEEGLALGRRSVERDPLSPGAHIGFGFSYYHSRRYDEAIVEFEKALALDPNSAGAFTGLGHTYLLKRMYPEAIGAYEKAKAVGSDSALVDLANAYARAGARDKALKLLEELKRLSKRQFVPPGAFLFVYTGLGDKDQAFFWMEKAFEERETTSFPWLKVAPIWDPLRSDPRFQDYLRRMHFPP